jgi:hypothetical protein
MRKLTTSEIVNRFEDIHNGRYDYSKVEYENSREKVTIICRSHGEFTQKPHDHMKGVGCPKCKAVKLSESKLTTTDNFILQALSVHKGKYSYELVEYKGATSKVSIICKIHGEFRQRPANHLQGQGCKKCSTILNTEKRRHSTEYFINKSNEIHGYKYDYSSTCYKATNLKVKIICKEHGEFYQVANDHLRGFGCKDCSCNAGCGFSKNRPGSLYIIACADYLKVGITNRTILERIHNINRSSQLNFTEILSFHFDDGNIPHVAEKQVLRYLRRIYKNPTMKFDGYTETFKDVNVDDLIFKTREILSTITPTIL